MIDYLYKAAEVAKPKTDQDYLKNFRIGAVGLRGRDNVAVFAKNMPIQFSNAWKRDPRTHAEGRVLRKMDKSGDGILFVARLSKTGALAMARPCEMCYNLIKAYRIKKVYYTINELQYGVLDVFNDYDFVYNL